MTRADPRSSDPILIKRLTYAKYLYNVARQGLDSPSPLVASEALLRLHDSVEIFQLAILDVIGVPKGKHGGFMDFWERVKEKTGHELPFKNRFAALNNMRAGFKHHAVLPESSELREASGVVHEFFSDLCHQFLSIDFALVSLADLVDDTEAQEHMKMAEAAMASDDLPEALSELALAFDLVISRRESSLPRSISLSLFHESALSHRDLRLGGGGLPSEGRARMEENFRKLQSQVQEIKNIFEMLAWGVDLHQYRKFRHLTPHVIRTFSGHVQLTWPGSCRSRLRREDAEFALQFVVDSALKVQRRKFRVVDPRSPVMIRVIVEAAKLFRANPNNTVTSVGEIPAGCDLVGTFVHVAGLGEAWHVNYEGREGYLRVADAMAMYEALE